MNEEFIAFLWKFRMAGTEMFTTEGEVVSVLYPGQQNSDGGPDFFNARVRIGSTAWAGNVEIHVKASDWLRHGHNDDPAYDNVILHVVAEADIVISRSSGVPIPTIVLESDHSGKLFTRYRDMLENCRWIPCATPGTLLPETEFRLWSPALAVERLKSRSESIRQLWTASQYDWEETLYRLMARCFGFNLNGVAFELLAKSIPLNIIRRHAQNHLQIEAMLYGQSGLLPHSPPDEYTDHLSHEYRFLAAKYQLEPHGAEIWKYLRLRPVNFPTLRISQFAAFLNKTGGDMAALMEIPSLHHMRDLLDGEASTYWNDHYLFGKRSPARIKRLGEKAVDLLAINGYIPFIFFTGLEKDSIRHRETSLSFLEQTSGEENHVITEWSRLGLSAANALQTQALMMLKSAYCDKRRCLECRLGAWLLGNIGKFG